MKLITKISLRYLLFSLLVWIVFGVAMYKVLEMVLHEETDEKLMSSLHNVERNIDKTPQLVLLEPFILIEEIDSVVPLSVTFSNIILPVENEEDEGFRQLVAIRVINGKTYRITIRESVVESENVFETIALLVLGSISLMIVILFIINVQTSKSVWKPFFANLGQLKNFSVRQQTPYLPSSTSIYEFNEMNCVVEELTDKVISDYRTLKQFSEDASHELQTPLAIIRSKIESLIESSTLDDKQMVKVQSVYDQVTRLVRLNKELLLLAKIENQQFDNQGDISFKNITVSQVELFEELAGLKNITITVHLKNDWQLTGDLFLAETLVNNLLSNAVKHNVPNGTIHIELTCGMMIISNTGNAPLKHADRIFDRFYKEKQSGSSGLGLSIVKQICETLNLVISYRYKDGSHSFILEKYSNNTIEKSEL